MAVNNVKISTIDERDQVLENARAVEAAALAGFRSAIADFFSAVLVVSDAKEAVFRFDRENGLVGPGPTTYGLKLHTTHLVSEHLRANVGELTEELLREGYEAMRSTLHARQGAAA
jgi:hypothetical protein